MKKGAPTVLAMILVMAVMLTLFLISAASSGTANAAACTGQLQPVGDGTHGPTGQSGQPALVPISPQGPQETPHWSAEQIRNASTITNVARSRQLVPRAAVIAVATAMQESTLQNLNHGDRDSLGLFQQRPSQGWGTASQITDPVYASNQYLDALVKVRDWQTRPLTDVAADVQHPDERYRSAYAKWEQSAADLVSSTWGTAAVSIVNSGGATCAGAGGDGRKTTDAIQLPAGFTLPAGTPVQVVTAIRFGISKLGMPYQWGGVGNPSYDCSGLMMKAYEAAGITITRTTFSQVSDGAAVPSAAQLLPGDLIFTAGSDGTRSNPGHVGMYLGSDLVLDAPQTGKNIQITHFSGGYWNREAVAFRRIAT